MKTMEKRKDEFNEFQIIAHIDRHEETKEKHKSKRLERATSSLLNL